MMTSDLTLPEIYARLHEIAPTPDPDATDVVRSLSVSLLVAAQLRFARSVSPRVPAEEALSPDALAAMCGQFAALHALAALNRTDPAEAVRAARDIALAWEGGGAIGEWLWCHGTDLGVSTEEVARLADAEAAAKRAEPDTAGIAGAGEGGGVPDAAGAAVAAERERILAVAERLKEPHTGPRSNGAEYAVPLSVLRAALLADAGHGPGLPDCGAENGGLAG